MDRPKLPGWRHTTSWIFETKECTFAPYHTTLLDSLVDGLHLMATESKHQQIPTSFKRRPQRTIWIVMRWYEDYTYQLVRAFPSYGLAELWILGTLDEFTYTIEKCIY